MTVLAVCCFNKLELFVVVVEGKSTSESVIRVSISVDLQEALSFGYYQLAKSLLSIATIDFLK
eukprot:c47403_g1_i1 orf=266-454(+)